ncbi:cytochrome P450 [Nannocystis pusilla]|uniref:cytochrome P450 n=1 Tax=Nannocystis pusilla TaxID=889268 RepID=UPI003DA24BD2
MNTLIHPRTEQALRLPGPAGYPLVGALPTILREGVFEYVERCWREYGDFFQIPTAGRSRIIFTAHPDAIERILHTRVDNYYKGKGYDPLRPLLGNGLITSTGDFWVRQRKLTQPAFHMDNLRRMVPVMARCVEDMLGEWEARRRGGAVLDLHAESMHLAQRIVGFTLFGMDLSDREAASSRAVTESLEIAGQRMNRGAMALPLSVPTPANLRFRRALRTLDEIVYDIIGHARKAGPEAQPTLLRLLMEARDDGSGDGMSDQQLRDEIVTHYVAGHETTALILTWTFWFLSQHPDVYAKVREEIAGLGLTGAPTIEDLDRLTYTRMVFDEVMRLRPPVWAQTRTTREDDILLARRIPADSFVMFSAYFCHHHPAFWDEPTAFRPERFTPERVRARHRYAHIPFSAGPRACIGKRYALYELSTALALILTRFRIDVLPGQEVGIRPTATVHPDRPIYAHLRSTGR